MNRFGRAAVVLATAWAFAFVGFAVFVAASGTAHAEVVEEIVAWVDGDIITKSDVDQEEEALTADLYRRFSGDELDAQMDMVRAELLGGLIDRKIMMHRAARLYDFDSLGEQLVEQFRRSQNFANDEEMGRWLAGQGMTLDELEQRLLEAQAPEEIIQLEVRNRVSVGDRECADFYDQNTDLFIEPLEVTVSEIVLLASEETPEVRDDKRAEATRILEIARGPGADFAALATEHSEAGTAADGGVLGTFGKGDLAELLEAAVLPLPAGEVSGVIEAPYGFHIVRVDERRDERQLPFDEVKEQVRNKLEEQKLFLKFQEFVAKAREESEVRINPKYRARLGSWTGPVELGP